MEENIGNHFPRDLDTMSIIKEIEEYLGIPHSNIMVMENFGVHEYINKLILLLMQVES